MAKKASAKKTTASKAAGKKKAPSIKAAAKSQPKSKVVAKKKASFKKPTAMKSSLKAQPKEKATVETTLESPREPGRELESGSLVPQAKMKLPRKNERSFREQQQSQAKPNSVNPAGRR